MLCCISRRAISRADHEPPFDRFSSKEQPVEMEKLLPIEQFSDSGGSQQRANSQSMDTDVPPILLPCAICARTFMPGSLEKHTKICEQQACRKRKPFDSAKQRIQGTELAEFLPRQEKKRHSPDEKSSKPKSTWKQTHDDFLRAIRAARNEVVEPAMQRQSGGTTVTPNAPTRANEQGMCPTCNRHFGVKAYDRHVAWCKERIVRVTVSPATNVAKERLEARMKYRAPAVKSRRQVTREKYSPGSAVALNTASKTSPTLIGSRAKESVSAPSCSKNSDSPVKQKSVVTRRPVQPKEISNLTAAMKSRSTDRGSRLSEDEAGPVTFRHLPPAKRISHLPVPPLKYKRENLEDYIGIVPTPMPRKSQLKRTQVKMKREELVEIPPLRVKETKHQALHSARSQKTNIVSARSQGNPKLNDVSINEDIMGITVKPCNIYKEKQLTTWKQISEEKDCFQDQCKILDDPTRLKVGGFLDKKESFHELHLEETMEDLSLYKEQINTLELTLNEEEIKEGTNDFSIENEDINWPPSLDTTYSFRDTMINDDFDDSNSMKNKKWKPVRHSPRVEFRLPDPEKTKYTCVSQILSGYVDKDDDVKSDSRNSCKKVKEKSVKTENNLSLNTLLDVMSPDECAKTFKDQTPRIKDSETSLTYVESINRSEIDLQNNSPNLDAANDTSIDLSDNYNCTTKENNWPDNVQMKNENGNEDDTKRENSKLEDPTYLFNERLSPSTSLEQFTNLEKSDDFHDIDEPKLNCEDVDNNIQEINEFMFDNNPSDNETIKEIDLDDPEIEKDEIYDGSHDSVHTLCNGINSPTNIENINEETILCNGETDRSDIKPESCFTNGILQPTRSSTPFLNAEECLDTKCCAYEDFKRELSFPPENFEWKMEVDRETGSQVLYRVENKDSNNSSSRLSSRSKINDSEKVESDNDRFHFSNRSMSAHNEFNGNKEDDDPRATQTVRKCFSTVSSKMNEKEEIYSRVTTSCLKNERTEMSSRVQRKEIASQVNICNCSSKVFSKNNHEENVINDHDISPRNAYSEGQVCDTFLRNDSEMTRPEFVHSQATKNIIESNFNTDSEDNNEEKVNLNQDKIQLQEKETKEEEERNETEDKNNYDQEKTEIRNKKHEDSSNSSNFPKESFNKKIEVEEIYKNCSNEDFDCDSDNSIEHHIREAINGLKCSSIKSEKITRNLQNLRSIVLSESCVKMSKRVQVDDLSTGRSTALKSRRLKRFQIDSRVRENVNVLNESTDSLGSSVDAMDISDVKQVESIEVETIEEIGTRNKSIRFRILPEIKGTGLAMNENYDEKEKFNTQTYWEKASKASRNRLINLDPPCQRANRFLKRNPKVRILPPVPSSSSLIRRRNLELPLRPVWSNYVRRRPDFDLVLSGRTGKDYDPFLLAEQQMNDLLSDTSERSLADSPQIDQNRDSSYELSRSSAFAKYPGQPSLSNPDKRSSLIAPPTEFDDMISDFSSDSTETNSLSRELFLKDFKDSAVKLSDLEKKSPIKELSRKVIIDKSKALGKEMTDDASRGSRSFVTSSEKARKILDKVSPKVIRPAVSRSFSVRAASAPKSTPDRNTSNRSLNHVDSIQRSSNDNLNNRNNNYANLSSSNLSLSSIISSDVDIKRSNSVFDELMTSFEDENGSFSSLKSLLKDDPLPVSSPVHGRQRNGQISDEELSSPESYKRQDHSKMSADSAYSSLNRKHSHHGRSTNDVGGRGYDEEASKDNRRENEDVPAASKCKMSKFCHECGYKFPKTAKFCCECGIKRLIL